MILQKENKILRETAEKIADIKSADIKSLIHKMAEAMFKEPDGIGIAGPQIGESKKIFLVAEDVLHLERFDDKENNGFDKLTTKRTKNYLVFINPIFKNRSSKKTKDVEGCLSVRGMYGDVARAEKITIEYFDESGNKKTRGASGLFARVIQHEMDHLEGILFIDKAKNIKKIKN